MVSNSLVSHRSAELSGAVKVPGDKSISHRALILAAMADGESQIHGLNTGDDIIRNARALQSLGIKISWRSPDLCTVQGTAGKSFKQPKDVLHFGNSGTAVRLFCGVLAGQPIHTTLVGDQSLKKRPMRRVLKPLQDMGAFIGGTQTHHLPISLLGNSKLKAISYPLPMPSAQVKSAILLAGLRTEGKTEIIEPLDSRDHTERLIKEFGGDIHEERNDEGERYIALEGGQSLTGTELHIPGDASSAAFMVVAALITPGSKLTVQNVCWNPIRRRIFDVLKEMGGNVLISGAKVMSGEEVVDIEVKYSHLKAVDTPYVSTPALIDEYPILSIAAAFAEGESRFKGLQELRYKESDRLIAIAKGLRACGVGIEINSNDLTIHGCGPEKVPGGAIINSYSDHRIAMSFLILGLSSILPVTVGNPHMIPTSFPGFLKSLQNMGALITNT